mmetsp:Transcript_2985/g.9283  ORF Transcript_2985/g.9283 Transcript_2985/m.9283 type:complete len:333 (-) Transcript_2985:1346-2344(-)
MRIRPDLGSFSGHCLTSTTSPTFSLRGASLESPSISRPSVRIVSLTTLYWRPPSFRKTVPWFPTAETQPATPSFSAMTLWRITPLAVSFTGPLTTLTTSSRSRRRVVLLSLMHRPSVSAVCLTTYMYMGTTCLNFSSDKVDSPSSQNEAKTSARSSGASSMVSDSGSSFSFPLSFSFSASPSSFSASPSWAPSSLKGLITLSAVSNQAMKSCSLMAPVPPASNRPKRSSSESSSIICAYLATFSAAVRTFSTSPARFLPTSSWKRAIKLVARLIRWSIRPSLESCFFVSLATYVSNSALNSSSIPCFRPSIFSCATLTAAEALLMIAPISSA